MRKRVNAAWLQPVSTDPSLLVNREDELEELVARLEELREASIHDAHFLITGARGVGKSIFSRAALQRFEIRHPDQAICIRVDSRGLRYRPFLNKFAGYLVDAVKPHAEKGKRIDILRWLEQLALFANQSQITRGHTETIGRKYGADASLGMDLFYKLQSKLSWEETRSLGATLQTTLTVTDDLLHDAISATLDRLAQPDSRWIVVVFFDDLDQVADLDRESDVVTLFRKVVDLGPCISLVHFRTEALVENVAREATERIHLAPLTPVNLFEMVQRRLIAATEGVRNQFPPDTNWNAIHQLAKCSGVPLVFLRWVHGLLRTQSWPPSATWTSAAEVGKLIAAEDPHNGADDELVHRLVEIVDRCDGRRIGITVRREDLLRGCLSTDSQAPKCGLSDQEIDYLVKLQVLLPKHRYDPTLGYCIKPVLDLLRPSVRQKL